MNVTELLRDLDAEIARLEKARETIASLSTTPVKRGPGRPKSTAATPVKKVAKKRTMSAEARAKIAAAAKKRWAAKKKA